MPSKWMLLTAAVILTGFSCSMVDVRAAEPVKLVTGANYAPFTDAALPMGGVVTEVVTAAFAEAGVAVAPVLFSPWKRGYDDVKANAIDGTFPYVRTPEREAEMVFSDVVYESPAVAIFAADTTYDYTGPGSLKGRTLCQPLGNASPLQAQIDSGEIKVVMEPRDYAQCVLAVVSHRADFMTAHKLVIFSILRETNAIKTTRFASVPVEVRPNYLLVSKTNPRAKEIIAEFNAGLAKLKTSGKYDEIFARHLSLTN